MSLGVGFAFVALSSTALSGISARDAGVASALVNTTQQVGGSLGTALLNTIAASVTASYIAAHGAGAAAPARFTDTPSRSPGASVLYCSPRCCLSCSWPGGPAQAPTTVSRQPSSTRKNSAPSSSRVDSAPGSEH
jgi:hypothetical protein